MTSRDDSVADAVLDGTVLEGADLTDRTVALAAVLVAGAVLRLYALGRESLWMDEVYSVTDALRFTTVELLTVLPLVKDHTPAYYVFLRHWAHAVGLSETMLRLPTALAGVATVYVTFRVGERLFDWRTGALAAAMVALSRFHVNHSQEVRMYGFVALLTAVSFHYLVGLSSAYSRRSVAGYLLSTALLVYTHPYGVFVILAQNLYVWSRLATAGDLLDHLTAPSRLALVDDGVHSVRRWVGVQAGLGLLLVPYGVVLVRRLLATATGSYTPLGWREPPGPVTLVGTLVRYFGHSARPVVLLVGVPVLVALVGLAAFRRSGDAGEPLRRRLSVRTGDRWAVALLACWLAVPVLVPAVLSHLLSPVYGVRYTIGASLALFLLVARGLTRLDHAHLRAAAVALLVVALLVPLPGYYATTQNEQWRQATGVVADRAEGGDLVLLTDNDIRKAWDVYTSRPELAVRTATNESEWRELRGRLARYETIWVLNRTYPATNHNRPAAVVLADTHRLVETRSYYGVKMYRFERRANATRSPEATAGWGSRLREHAPPPDRRPPLGVVDRRFPAPEPWVRTATTHGPPRPR